MADTVHTIWAHPPTLNVSPVLDVGTRHFDVLLLCTSDGTGETNALKIDLDWLTGTDGVNPPKALHIEKLEYDIQGFTAVTLSWDRDVDQPFARLSGQGKFCWEKGRGYLPDSGSGGTGDILLTTTGATSGDTYTVRIKGRVVASE